MAKSKKVAEAPTASGAGAALSPSDGEALAALGRAATPDRHRVARALASKLGGPLESAEPVALALLKDGDAKLRAAGARLLAVASPGPGAAAAKVAAQLKKETDDLAKASELLALGSLARRAGTREYEEVLYKSTGDDPEVRKKPSEVVAVAATIASAWADPLSLTATMPAFLSAHGELRFDPDQLPWNEGDLGGLAGEAARLVGRVDVEAFKARVHELARLHPRVAAAAGPSWPPAFSNPYGVMAHRIFAKFDGRAEDEVLLEELDPDQLEVARFALELDLGIGAGSPTGFTFRLPRDEGEHAGAASERRFLGLDPAGPLDRRLTLTWRREARSFPLWKWFRILTRKQIEADLLSAAIRGALTPAEIIDLGRDATTMIYAADYEDSPIGASPRSLLLANLLDELGDAASAPDLDAIRHVLRTLGGDKAGKRTLRERGWKAGPFPPP